MTGAVHHVADAASGLALERAFFAAGDAVAAVWSAAGRALVCPASYRRREGFAVAARQSCARGWPVYQRSTGGGVVPQGPGVMNFVMAFNAPEKFSLEDGYRLLSRIIIAGFGAHGPALSAGGIQGSFCNGAWNLCVKGKKLVGTAQRWRLTQESRPRVLAHALILTRGNALPHGADAVSALQIDLGLSPVAEAAHTSMDAAFGMADMPSAALLDAAGRELATVHTADFS